jgi:hypothetical protein
MKHNIKPILWILAPLVLASCSITLSSRGNSDTVASWDSTASAASAGTAVSVDTSVASVVTATSVSTGEYTGTIALAQDGSTFTGSNIAIADNVVTISAAGTYLVTGTLTNGSILITANDDGDVELDLNGVSITRSGSGVYAPISSINGDHLEVKKLNGTVNVITDSRSSCNSTANDAAAIFANKKLKMTGAGTLTVTASLKNGIASDTKIETKNGTLKITAKNHGIKAHDYIALGDETDGGTLIIATTAGDGVHVDEDYTASMDTDEFAGIKLINGSFAISAYDDGLSSASNIYIEGGEGTIQATDTAQADGSKGITADLAINLDGGTYSITSANNDAVDATGKVTVNGGTYTLSAGKSKSSAAPQGIHSGSTVRILGGTTTVTQSYEGIEGVNIEIGAGTTYLTSSDDGLNAGGGNDSSGEGTSAGNITISGGYVYVAAAGDGIDANGNIVVSGGFTVVSQTGNGNGPMDYGDGNYSFKQSGGFLAAYGSNDMAVGSSGTQYSLLAGWTSAVSTSQYIVVSNAGQSYALKPQYASAYSLYISSNGFTAGSVSVASASSISGGSEVFKGVYTGFSASSTTSIGSSTWSTSAVNLSIGTGSSGGGTPGGGGGHGW